MLSCFSLVKFEQYHNIFVHSCTHERTWTYQLIKNCTSSLTVAKRHVASYISSNDKNVQFIASNYELYTHTKYSRFLYTLLNEKIFLLLANQRHDKYSLAHTHSTDAHIHTYGQYMMCAGHSVLCIRTLSISNIK